MLYINYWAAWHSFQRGFLIPTKAVLCSLYRDNNDILHTILVMQSEFSDIIQVSLFLLLKASSYVV